MTIEELLAQVLGGGQQPVNRMSGNWNGPDSAPNRLVAPQAGPPAAMAPQGAPMPAQQQNASVRAPQPSGGGFLSRLFGGGANDDENYTVNWLTQQGMDPGTATMMARHKPSLQAYLLERAGLGSGGSDQTASIQEYEYAKQQGYTGSFQDWDASKRGGAGELGLNIVYAKDKDGNLVAFQTSKAGGLVQADLPEGYTLEPGTGKIDLGTEWGITDRSGAVIQRIPKDLAGEAAAKAGGTKAGEAQFDLPRVEQNAAQTLGVLERMKTHPGMAGSVGFIEGLLPSRSTEQVDFQSLVDQTQGQAFLQAFQMLKGGGQITEIEGAKATAAISRLGNQRLSDKDYLQAITDLEEVINTGLQRARIQAGQPAQPAAPGALEAPAAPAAAGTDVDVTTMPPPEGMTPEIWKFVPPEQRRLWLQ